MKIRVATSAALGRTCMAASGDASKVAKGTRAASKGAATSCTVTTESSKTTTRTTKTFTRAAYAACSMSNLGQRTSKDSSRPNGEEEVATSWELMDWAEETHGARIAHEL